MISHAITFLDDVAMHVPTLNAWDQFVWLLDAAMLQAAMEVEQYSYHCGHAIDLGPVMLATRFRVTDKVGMYLCAAQALVFEGSVLAYNPARDEAEWVPTRGITNDLSWVEEKSAMALANFVPHISKEAACITGLRTHHLMSWPDSSSLEDGEQDDDEWEDDKPEGDEHEEAEGQGEAGPKSLSHGAQARRNRTRSQTTGTRTIVGVGVYCG